VRPQFDLARDAHLRSRAVATRNGICRTDAVTLAAEIRAKRISPVEVIDAVLERMERLEPHIHAFCTPAPDLARAAAKRIEAELAAGRDPGALAGVPVSIKDLIFTRGIRTTSGSVAYRDFIPDEDDVIVERLKAAGAIVIGKTNTAEFGYAAVGHNPVFETTRNPWNLERTTGGSSAGAGAAVATGVGPIAIGSDGGGSIRFPAALCGIYGFKASMGRIPLYPGSRDERFAGASGWESIECVGPMTRTVADSALVMSVTAGPDPRDRHSIPNEGVDWIGALRRSIRGKRIAYSADWGYAPVEPEVAAIARDAARVFERDLGCIIEEASPGWDDPAAGFAAVMIAETDLAGMRAMVARHGRAMSQHLVDLLSLPWTAEQLTSGNVGRKAVVNNMWRFMARYDLLLTPTSPVPAFAINVQGPEKIAGRYGRPQAIIEFTFPMNLTGQPAASVPAGWTADGLPVGLQIVGRHLDDATVLAASAAYEAARPWKDRWPPLLERLGL
jgi:aspartyl-tRNA(Asn)/glutamyl-tRNA(Gln) amidotransferase subunit A